MIPKSMINEVKRLLAEERLSQRKIAKLTGVSRGSVGAIASGRRRDRVPSSATSQDDMGEPVGPPERCRYCGALVYLPCRLCGLRKLLKARRFPRRPKRPLGPLAIELRDDHRARYEQVRRRCRQAGERTERRDLLECEGTNP